MCYCWTDFDFPSLHGTDAAVVFQFTFKLDPKEATIPGASIESENELKNEALMLGSRVWPVCEVFHRVNRWTPPVTDVFQLQYSFFHITPLLIRVFWGFCLLLMTPLVYQEEGPTQVWHLMKRSHSFVTPALVLKMFAVKPVDNMLKCVQACSKVLKFMFWVGLCQKYWSNIARFEFVQLFDRHQAPLSVHNAKDVYSDKVKFRENVRAWCPFQATVWLLWMQTWR